MKIHLSTPAHQVEAQQAEGNRAKHAANRKAVEYFQRGADMGESECMASLADHYLCGLGVKEDHAQALLHQEEAAQAGNAMVCSRSMAL